MSTAEEIFTQTDGTDFTEFKEGMRDGIPIGAGYFAVSFALGIAMRNAGMSWFEGFMLSFTNLASAGEYAAIQGHRFFRFTSGNGTDDVYRRCTVYSNVMFPSPKALS
jgi:hypothetical protein